MGGPDEKIFGSRSGRKDELAGAHLGLISHAGVFRGARISSLLVHAWEGTKHELS